MSLMIHGKEYITVAERVKMLHDKNGVERVAIETEVLAFDPVVVKATVTIDGNVFCGISAANPNKSIEKQSPYEVAETSAVGRALGFAGFGLIDGLATADEMVKAEHTSVAEAGKRPSKSLTMPSRTIEEHESGKYCRKCNGSALEIKISSSEKNPGREYYHCSKCKGFSHWAGSESVATNVTAPAVDDDVLLDWVDQNVGVPT